LVHTAIGAAVSIEKEPTPVERVLAGIKKAFDTVSARTKKDVDRLSTADLLAEMLADQDAEWDTEYRGRPITAYWMRGVLRGLLEPPGAKDWWEPEGKPRQQQKKCPVTTNRNLPEPGRCTWGRLVQAQPIVVIRRMVKSMLFVGPNHRVHRVHQNQRDQMAETLEFLRAIYVPY
jgi:hypothetical protein